MRDKLQHIELPTGGDPPGAAPTGSAPTRAGRFTETCQSAAATIGATGASFYRSVSESVLVISVALYTSVVLMLITADTALAQGGGGGGGGEVEGALQSAVDWLSNIIVVAGTLGLLIAAVFWIFSGSNERRRQAATGWVASCAIAIAVAFLAPSLVTLIQEWTGGGGGGGA